MAKRRKIDSPPVLHTCFSSLNFIEYILTSLPLQLVCSETSLSRLSINSNCDFFFQCFLLHRRKIWKTGPSCHKRGVSLREPNQVKVKDKLFDVLSFFPVCLLSEFRCNDKLLKQIILYHNVLLSHLPYPSIYLFSHDLPVFDQ